MIEPTIVGGILPMMHYTLSDDKKTLTLGKLMVRFFKPIDIDETDLALLIHECIRAGYRERAHENEKAMRSLLGNLID